MSRYKEFNESVNDIKNYYDIIKAFIQRKYTKFFIEFRLLGVRVELSYRNGELYDINFPYLNDRNNIKIKALCKDKIIKYVEKRYIDGIPHKIKELDDITKKGIITLNKNVFIRFCKNVQSNNNLENRNFDKNLSQVLGQVQDDYSLNRNNSYLDLLFCCLMLNYPYWHLNPNGIDQDYPVNIIKNLYEFIAVKSNQQYSSNIDGFNYYSKYLSDYCDLTATVKIEFKNLKEILNYLRSLVRSEIPFVCWGLQRLSFKSSNKKDHEKVRKAELDKPINFIFDPRYLSLAFNPKNEKLITILEQLDIFINTADNSENVCNNYKTIPSTFEVFSGNNIALGDFGETIVSFFIMILNNGYVPLNHIDIKDPSNPKSNRHGIDLIFERINIETNTKEWLIIEVKVNESKLSNKQGTKEWIMEKLKNDIADSKKRTEIETVYNADPSRVSVFLARLGVKDFQKKIKDVFYNTPIDIELSKLNDAAKIEKTESISTTFTVPNLKKNSQKFEKFFRAC